MVEVAVEDPADPRGYLLANLETLVTHTLEHDRGVWLPSEIDRWEAWRALPITARRVWARLVSRVGPWFRCDQVRDPGSTGVEVGLRVLEQAGWVEGGGSLPLAARLALLRRPELVALGEELGLRASRSWRKRELVAALAELPALDDHPELGGGRFLRPRHVEDLDRARLLFFGDLDHDWTEWLLRDLGVTRFESYEVDRTVRRFASREELDRAFGLRRAAATVDGARRLSADELAAQVSPWLAVDRKIWAPRERRLVARCATAWGRQLEREGRLDEALEVLTEVGAAPARERAIRVATALGRHHLAQRLCGEVLADPQDPIELDLAQHWEGGRRRVRARPRWLVEIHTLERRDEPVEVAVAHALATRGAVHFTENWWWRAVFGLLFWDAIFAPLPGVFLHPFQTGPADLYQPEFRSRREALIAERLDWIGAAGAAALRSTAAACWEAKSGIANDFVGWEPRALDVVLEALGHVEGKVLAAVFDRLIGNLRWYRRGFPDLMVLTPTGVELHEVKGPGDQLRPEQRAWLDFFAQLGVPSVVARVKWSGPVS